MKYKLFAPDGMEIGYITDSPEFDYKLVENAPFREEIETIIEESADYEMVVAGGPDEMEDDAVTPPEENVPASDFFRVVRLSTNLQSNAPVQVEEVEETKKTEIASDLASLLGKKRRYVQNPAEAPDGVSLEEGPQGGVYYETESEGGESEESGSEQNSLDDHKQSIADAFRESLEEEEENDNDDYYDEILDNVDIDTESKEMIRDMQFEEIKDMIQERVVDNMADVMERCHSEEVRHTFLSEIAKIKNKVQQSAFSSETKHIQFYTFVGSSTVQHEFGHAIAGTHDFELGSNGTSMYSRMYDDEIPDFQFGRTYKEVFDEWLDTKSEEARASWKSSEPYEELTNQFDIPMEKEHFKLSQVEGKTTAIDGLIEEVNNAWETMAEVPDNPDMDEEEYIFNRAYAATNAHETMAGIHETMQGKVGNEQAMENLVYRYPDLLHEYLELFEPSINPKQTIAKMWYRNGEELPGFDEAPFDMSQSDAYGF